MCGAGGDVRADDDDIADDVHSQGDACGYVEFQ